MKKIYRLNFKIKVKGEYNFLFWKTIKQGIYKEISCYKISEDIIEERERMKKNLLSLYNFLLKEEERVEIFDDEDLFTIKVKPTSLNVYDFAEEVSFKEAIENLSSNEIIEFIKGIKGGNENECTRNV